MAEAVRGSAARPQSARARRLLVVLAVVAGPLLALALFSWRPAPVDAAPEVAPPVAAPLPPEVPRADLAVLLRATPVAPEAGRPLTHTLDLVSRGPDTTRRTTLVHTLAPGVVFRSAAAPPGTRCSPRGDTVTCTGPGMRPGERRTVRIEALVPDAADGVATTTARVSSDLPDPTPRDDVAASAPRVVRNADLVAGAVVPPAPVVAGGRTTVDATVTNRGPATADGVVLAAVLPPGTSVVSATTAAGACAPSGSEVSCPLSGPLPRGARATARVVVAVDPAAAGAVVPVATATATTPDPRPAGGTALGRVAVAPRAALASTTTGPATLLAGGEGAWTTVVTNRGPSVARAVVVEGATRGAAVTGVDASSGTCAARDRGTRCVLGSLAPGESVRVRTTAAVAPGATGAPVRLTARARSATPAATARDAPSAAEGEEAAREELAVRVPAGQLPAGEETAGEETAGEETAGDRAAAEPREATTTTVEGAADEDATVTTEVADLADLAVAFSQALPRGLGGALDLATDFTVRARNLGPSDATAAVLVAEIPAGFRATALSPGCVLLGQRVTCRWPRVPAGGEVAVALATAQLPGLLPDLVTGPRQLSAAVSSAVPDPVRANDTATATPGGPAAADLEVVAAEPAGPVAAGEVVRRVVTVRNTGTAPVRGVVLEDVVVEGLTPVGLPPECRTAPGTTVCDLDGLAAGEARAVALDARVDPDRPAGPLTRSSVARAGGDPSPSDNRTSTVTSVDARADLRTTVGRADDGPLLAGGAPVTYRVRATNAGPSTAPGVVLDLAAPPAGLRVVGATAGGGTCEVRASRALCPVAPLAVGDAAEALVTVVAAGDLPAEGSALSATASSAVADPTPDDARAVLADAVTRAAELQARIDPEPRAAAAGEIVAGSRTTLRVALTDLGPSTAPGTVLTTTLPAGAQALSATSTRGPCTVRLRRVDCAAGDLPAGGGVVATVVVTTPPETREPLTVVATGTSTGPAVGPAPFASTTLGVVPPPAPPEASIAAAEAAGLDPGVGNPSGPGEGLTIAAQLGRLPSRWVAGAVLVGASAAAVLLLGLARGRGRDRDRDP